MHQFRRAYRWILNQSLMNEDDKGAKVVLEQWGQTMGSISTSNPDKPKENCKNNKFITKLPHWRRDWFRLWVYWHEQPIQTQKKKIKKLGVIEQISIVADLGCKKLKERDRARERERNQFGSLVEYRGWDSFWDGWVEEDGRVYEAEFITNCTKYRRTLLKTVDEDDICWSGKKKIENWE